MVASTDAMGSVLDTDSKAGNPYSNNGEAAKNTSSQIPEKTGTAEGRHWLDESHSYVVTHADNIAEWMNQFFGDVRTEEDAPYSTLRLRFEQEWDQENHFDSDIKLRGKVYLPNLNERISLLFNEDDTSKTGQDDLLIDERDTTQKVTVQYRARDKDRYKIDYRVGIRSNLNLKTSVRYLYEYPLMETLIGTASEEILYLGGDGFASKTRLELDKILSEDKIIQWHNKIEWQENEPGVIWISSISLDKKLSETTAFSYFAGVTGETRPDNIISEYYVGVRYRQNMFRPWLFGEVQPSYRWTKPYAGAERENAAVILFRIEAVFLRDFSKQ